MSDEMEDFDEETEGEVEENPELEAEFRALVKKHQAEIDEQLKIASKAIAKAEKLSEKYGIPFSSGVSPLGQSYTPASFQDKFGELDRETVMEITDVYPGGEYDMEGWEHSAVCY